MSDVSNEAQKIEDPLEVPKKRGRKPNTQKTVPVIEVAEKVTKTETKQVIEIPEKVNSVTIISIS